MFSVGRAVFAAERPYHQVLTGLGAAELNVQDLFRRVSWDDVAGCFAQLYPDDIENLEGLKKVFNQVRTCAPVTDPQEMMVSIDLVQDEDERWYDVYGRVPGERERCTFELCLYREWAGFLVDEKLLQQMSPREIVSHMLREMTFYGYSDEDILAQRQEIENLLVV